MMKLGRFMKNDDYILMGRAGYIPNHKIIQKLKHCKIRPEIKDKFFLQDDGIKIMNYQTFLKYNITNYAGIEKNPAL